MKIWRLLKWNSADTWRELLVVKQPPPFACLANDIFGETPGFYLIITEAIFEYPGMGVYFLRAAGNGDFPQLMPYMVIIIISVLMFNLLADLTYAVLDPRIRLD